MAPLAPPPYASGPAFQFVIRKTGRTFTILNSEKLPYILV